MMQNVSCHHPFLSGLGAKCMHPSFFSFLNSQDTQPPSLLSNPSLTAQALTYFDHANQQGHSFSIAVLHNLHAPRLPFHPGLPWRPVEVRHCLSIKQEGPTGGYLASASIWEVGLSCVHSLGCAQVLLMLDPRRWEQNLLKLETQLPQCYEEGVWNSQMLPHPYSQVCIETICNLKEQKHNRSRCQSLRENGACMQF